MMMSTILLLTNAYQEYNTPCTGSWGHPNNVIFSESEEKASDSERATLPLADHFDFLLGKNLRNA